jgi:hypothetical protein
MVIAIFLGEKSSGCYGVDNVNLWRSDNKLYVSYRDIRPGPLVLCTANMTAPSILIETARSDEKVEFNAINFAR